MPLPPRLREKYLKRFDELIMEGEQILGTVRDVPPPSGVISAMGWGIELDSRRHEAWRVGSISLLSLVLPRGHVHRRTMRRMGNRSKTRMILLDIARLRAVRHDFEHDLLGDVAAQIEAEVASDYMGQAEGLLAEGVAGGFDHVPAAVLAGAVLERALRSFCTSREPPIPLARTAGGRTVKKMLNDLIDDVKGAGLYNEARAKQLRGFAAIRNHAAHGEFDQFTRTQVVEMVAGIGSFLVEVLG